MSSPSHCSIPSSRAYDPRASARSARSTFLATGQEARSEASATSQTHGPSTTISPREILMKYGRPFAFWAQLGLENEEAKKMLSKNKVPYVMNACLRVVHKLL